MTTSTDSAGKPVEATPIREVVGLITADETGRQISVVPIRYVGSITTTDEMGRPIGALPVVTASGAMTTDGTGKTVRVMPVRVVAGLLTTNEAGLVVPVLPVVSVDGVLDPTLTAPVLSLAVAGDQYPPQLSVDLDDTYQSGDILIVEWADNINFTGSSRSSAVIGDTEANANAASISGLSSLNSGVHFFRVWMRRGNSIGATSNIVAHGDVVAPTITASATGTVAENSVLAFALTGTDTSGIASWAIAGGVDSSRFEISGSALRWTGNTTRDYEAPVDTGTNNVYNVTVTATDYAGNTSAPFAIAITVNDIDDLPNSYSFTAVSGAAQSTHYDTSASPVTVGGLGSGVSVAVTLSGPGFYYKNGVGPATAPTTAINGDTFYLSDTSGATEGNLHATTLRIGEGSATWNITTAVVPIYRYFRLYVTGNDGTTYTALAEIELAEAASGPDTTQNATATASSNIGSGFVASKAIDNNNSTLWHSGANTFPQWLVLDYGATSSNWTKPAELRITSRDDNAPYTTPGIFKLQGSTNNSTWVDLLTVTTVTPGWTGSSETKAFAIP